jgi:Arc/MetJ family transcription regulator
MAVKRTSINLDLALVGEAKRVLGTKQTTETVHRALEEVVRRQKLKRFLESDLPDLTLEALEEMRKPDHPDFRWS